MKTIIIGGVAAGMSAASKLKRLDPKRDIVVYEKGHDLSYGACGMPYFLSNIIEKEASLVARTKDQFEASGITVKTGHEVIGVFPKEKTITFKNETSEGTDYYDDLIIATGASPIHIPVNNHTLKGIYPLNSLRDAVTLKEVLKDAKNVAIIGAGFIGMEVAENMIHMGKTVHMIELSNQVLAPYDKAYADKAQKILEDAGVLIHLEEGLQGYLGEGHVTSVVTDKNTYSVDVVIEAVGVKPNTAFLKDTGLSMIPNGAIIVNEYGETNLKNIYAAGDCVAYPHQLLKEPAFVPLGTHANKLGRVIAERLFGNLELAFQGVIGSNILKVMDYTVAKTGLTMKDNERLSLNLAFVDVTAKDHAGYYPGATPIDIRLVYDKDSKVIKGAQMVGLKGVANRINIMATVISQKMTASDLAGLDLAYSPPFQPVWDPLQVAANQIK